MAEIAQMGGEAGGRWITVGEGEDAKHIYITAETASHEHFEKAKAKYGFGEKAHSALKAAHKAGTIQTHSDIHQVAAHAEKLKKQGLEEEAAYKTASALHKAGATDPLKAAPHKTGGVHEMPPSELHTDPDRFQYKVNVGSKGTSGELREVQKWNPNLAGVVLAWHDPSDEKSYVVNGHHRHELASRLGVDKLDVRHIDAPDAQTARYIGAVANIAEGRGTPIDAAKLMRDSEVTPEKLAEEGVSLKGKLATDGVALAKLPEALWRSVYKGEMPISRGVVIGGSGLRQSDQMLLHSLAEKQEKHGKRLSDKEVGELAQHIQSAGHATTQTSNLFGDEEVKQNLFVEKAQLSNYLKTKLGQDKRLFGYVAKSERAQKLGEAGNTINVAENQKIAEQSAHMEELFNRLVHRSGPVADALHTAASRLAQGENADAIRSSLYEQVRSAISEALTGSGERSAPGAKTPDATGPHSGGSLFAKRPDGRGAALEIDRSKIVFDLEAPSAREGAFVLRTGKIFEAGEYEDKAFSMSPEEMEAACRQFEAGKPLNFEHAPCPLDGLMGHVERIWNDGRSLYADVSLNRHLDAIYRENSLPVRVSAELFRDKKTLAGLALVRHPRVSDAALMAAFHASAQPDRKVAAKMSFLEGLKALFRRAGVPEDEIATALNHAPPEKMQTAPADFSQHPEVVAMKRQIEEQKTLIHAQSEQVTAMLASQQEDRKLAQFKQDSVSVATLKRERKLTPAEADAYLTLAQDNPAAFAAILPLLQNREPLAQFSGPTIRAQNPWPDGTQDAGQKLVNMAEEKAKAEGVSMQAALIAVGQLQRELAAAHKADVTSGKGEEA